ncbi:hypothetical protein LDENG_00195520 [Lucifuga dentata]|nr:hypothetical protein LDENG_00195520 [Lucifuga dentata]
MSKLLPEDSSSDEGVGTSLSLCFNLFVHKLIFCMNAALCPGHLVRRYHAPHAEIQTFTRWKIISYKFPNPQ